MDAGKAEGKERVGGADKECAVKGKKQEEEKVDVLGQSEMKERGVQQDGHAKVYIFRHGASRHLSHTRRRSETRRTGRTRRSEAGLIHTKAKLITMALFQTLLRGQGNEHHGLLPHPG